MPKPTDIPSLIYTNLRAVHESRMRRLHNGEDTPIPHLTNAKIFSLMPDCTAIDWRRDAQEAILARTLSAMHTEFTKESI